MSRGRWAALVVLLLLVAASVSFRASQTLYVVDTRGQPVMTYVAYRYQGSISNFVHPVTYDASGFALARTDDEGRVRFPGAIHVHLPFPIQTHPSLQIEMVYAPRLHNALGRLADRAMSRPDVFEFDPAERRVVMSDVGDRPEMWAGTLANLSSMIPRVVPKPFRPQARLRDLDPVTAHLALELIAHFRQEYNAFLVRYGNTTRPWPRVPDMWNDDEKRRWTEMVTADLAKEPTWGLKAERLFGHDSSRLREYEAELR